MRGGPPSAACGANPPPKRIAGSRAWGRGELGSALCPGERAAGRGALSAPRFLPPPAVAGGAWGARGAAGPGGRCLPMGRDTALLLGTYKRPRWPFLAEQGGRHPLRRARLLHRNKSCMRGVVGGEQGSSPRVRGQGLHFPACPVRRWHMCRQLPPLPQPALCQRIKPALSETPAPSSWRATIA